MSYEVFALKYRPQRFDDVVGQDTVAETLARAVAEERVAHAFLFCGSRGVGKTSMARILSKSLNCPAKSDGSSEPCCVCEICRGISVGEDIDVIEIDGASNRGIENIRDIRENVGYVASRSPFKIYIIDEVHMLTIQAFNALLKVLEEPPAHVKFIFATTDPNNLPDTILSRCQRHEFRRIDEDDIVKRLATICECEGVTAGADVLQAIAQRAEGGMRDSVSMLDQVISYAGTTVELSDLQLAVGVLPRQHLERFVNAMADGDTSEVLTSISDAYEGGFDPQELLIQTTKCLRDFMVFQAAEGRSAQDDDGFFTALNQRMPLDRTMYVLKLFLNVRGDIKLTGCERVQLELSALKAARSHQLDSIETLMKRVEALAKGGPIVVPSSSGEPAGAPASQPTPEPKKAAAPRSAPAQENPSPSPGSGGMSDGPAAMETAMEREPAPTRKSPAISLAKEAPTAMPSLEEARRGWSSVVEALDTASGPLPAALESARPMTLESGRLHLTLPGDQRFALDHLQSRNGMQSVEAAVTRTFGVKLDLSYSLDADTVDRSRSATQDIYENSAVQKLLEHFEGSILNVESSNG